MNIKVNEYINSGNDLGTSGTGLQNMNLLLKASEIRLIAETTDVLASDKVLSSKPAKGSLEKIFLLRMHIYFEV